MNTRVEPLRAGLAILTAVAMVAAMMVVFSGAPAMGQEGNPPAVECADPLWNDDFWKVQVEDGTAILGDPPNSPETNVNEDAILLDSTDVSDGSLTWTNNHEDEDSVFRVVRKEGMEEGGEVINYDPPVPFGESRTITLDDDISHITFCFTEPLPEPEPGQIIIEKEVTEGSETSVAFTFTATGFTLSDNTLAHVESGSAEVEAGGDYSVSESVPEGWTLQSAECTSNEEGDDSTPEDINVSEGETVTCTFVNHEEEEPEPETGTIVVVKQVAEGDPQDVAFTFNTTGFTLSDNTLAHGESGSAEVAAGGDYSVSETVLAGWEQVSATCESTAAEESTPADINVSDGATVTCTFVNQIEEEVAGTTITTSTTSTTAPLAPVTTAEVLDTHVEAEELPFTGFESDHLIGMGVLLLASGLVLLGVTGRREES